jgi:hypothetical protein
MPREQLALQVLPVPIFGCRREHLHHLMVTS